MAGAARTPAKSFTPAEKDRCLMVVAFYSGNARRAHRAMKAQGLRIPVDATTLYQWMKHEPDRYRQCQEQMVPEVRARLAEEFESLVSGELDFQRKVLNRMQDKLEDIDPQHLGKTYQQARIASGIGVEKAQLLRGMPTEIRSNQSLDELKRQLAAKGYIDVEAEEVEPKELSTS